MINELKACPSCKYGANYNLPSCSNNYTGRWHRTAIFGLHYIRCWSCNFATETYMDKSKAADEWNKLA